jgi:hypothetical protein
VCICTPSWQTQTVHVLRTLQGSIWTPPHCTALHCTALHCTALHCIAGSYQAYPVHRCVSYGGVLQTGLAGDCNGQGGSLGRYVTDGEGDGEPPGSASEPLNLDPFRLEAGGRTPTAGTG